MHNKTDLSRCCCCVFINFEMCMEKCPFLCYSLANPAFRFAKSPVKQLLFRATLPLLFTIFPLLNIYIYIVYIFVFVWLQFRLLFVTILAHLLMLAAVCKPFVSRFILLLSLLSRRLTLIPPTTHQSPSNPSNRVQDTWQSPCR